MITLGSRYQDQVVTALVAPTGAVHHFVMRNTTPYPSGTRRHLWTSSDRIDMVAQRYYGAASSWWGIMDMNPELVDPFNIPPGTSVRVPGG